MVVGFLYIGPKLSSKFATGYEIEASMFLRRTEEEDQVKTEYVYSTECCGNGIRYGGIDKAVP
jgi:hypothetical protein